MDLLKKELERKKKALKGCSSEAAAAAAAAVKTSVSSGSSSRFLKAGALRRLQEEQEEAERRKRLREDKGMIIQKKRQKKEEEESKEQGEPAEADVKKKSTDTTAASSHPVKKESQKDAEDLASLSPDDVTARLRAVGLPVRLFGEQTRRRKEEEDHWDDSVRLERLGKALAEEKKKLATLSEKEEFRLGQGHGIRNPFLEKNETDSAPTKASLAQEDTEGKTSRGEAAQEAEEKEDEDDTNDPHKRIYKYFKGLLRQWEDDLATRPESVKRSVAGKNETKTQKQCKDYIRPLFKLCKSRKLEESLMNKILEIIDYCEQGEFVKAHDAYLDMAIGRAAWPIGVTQVGIHSRTGRAKIESKNVAHVMNSELQRKYLTSVKRLMSYAQKKRDDVDPSKKVMN